MPKLIHVKSARASEKERRCRRCGVEIKVGDSYKHMSKKTGPRSSVTFMYCSEHTPRPSEYVGGKQSDYLSILEGFEDDIEAAADIEDLEGALETLATEMEGMADEYRESADNIEQGFGHETELSMSLTANADAIGDFLVEVGSVQGELVDAASDLEVEDDVSEVPFDLEDLKQRAQDLVSEAPDME